MHAVNKELKARPEPEGQWKDCVEEITVAKIFGQRPHQVTNHEAKQHEWDAVQHQRIEEKPDNDRRIDDQRRQMMHARQLVEQIALKKARRGVERLIGLGL